MSPPSPSSLMVGNARMMKLDAYLMAKLSKKQQAFFDKVVTFLLAAAEEIAGRNGDKVSDVFPAIHKLKGRPSVKSGVDAVRTSH